MKTKSLCILKVVFAVFIIVQAAGVALAGQGNVSKDVNVTSSGPLKQGAAIDHRNAKPMPLPILENAPLEPYAGGASDEDLGTPGSEPGARGNSKIHRMNLKSFMSLLDKDEENCPECTDTAEENEGGENCAECNDMAEENEAEEIISQEYGTSNNPFTTSRVDLSSNTPSNLYPYAATGKLYFIKDGSSYVCTASMIKRGLIVTAAHCVANFGKNQWYSSWQFIPALSGTVKPYGTWNVTRAYAMSSYLNGTDTCSGGAACANDVAILVATPQNAVYPGAYTGWYGYGWNGYGFAPTSPKVTQINQMGYPVSHDSGLKMQRTDSQGFVSNIVNNTVWGSRQTGGSSGGPALVNFGAKAVLSGASLGTNPDNNILVGVTSWGYTDATVKRQGASPFTSTNIVSLVNSACAAYPAACTQ